MSWMRKRRYLRADLTATLQDDALTAGPRHQSRIGSRCRTDGFQWCRLQARRRDYSSDCLERAHEWSNSRIGAHWKAIGLDGCSDHLRGGLRLTTLGAELRKHLQRYTDVARATNNQGLKAASGRGQRQGSACGDGLVTRTGRGRQ